MYFCPNFLKFDNEIITDPALVKISFGNLPLPENIECTIQQPNTLRFTWTHSAEKGYGYDQAMVLAYDLKSGKAYGDPYGNDRDSCETVITIGVPKGETYNTYLAFIAADRSRQSESVYLGKFEF